MKRPPSPDLTGLASSPRRRWLEAGVAAALAAPLGRAIGASGDPRLIDLRLPDAQGRLQPVLERGSAGTWIDFWASWCTPCRQSFPWMNRLQAELSPRGLRIVAINVDTRRADADRFLQTHPPDFLCLFDPAGASARTLAIRGMPSSLLVGADGFVRFTHTGFRLSEAAALAERIRDGLERS